LLNKLIFANLGHRPVRTLLSVLAIAVEVTMILTLVGVSYGTLDGTADRARGVGADILFRPPGSSVVGLSSAPMSDKLPALLMQEPLGSVLGIALTYGTQWLMKHAVMASMVQETVYGWWPIATGIAIVGALPGAIVPGVKAVKQDVTEALSY
jgi:putative ABC transport system permease protein